MPSRIIREGWIDSETVDKLSKEAEIFFLRLCLKADDFGRYVANPVLLKSSLYPLKEAIRSTDIPRWLAECEKAGLVRCYEHSGKRYLEIPKFRQRARGESKYPPPETGKILPPDSCPADDGQMTDSCPQGAALGVVGGEGVLRATSKSPPQDDFEWRKTLQASEAYKALNIEAEFQKMSFWCQQKRATPSRRRFLNWINKALEFQRGMAPAQSKPSPELPEFRAPRRTE